ncbi:nucleoside 2-deoxyribosyltransferase [Lactococcus phage P1048]|uniref:Nucleoside 2-deoxyribosyltransferase n=1 Tax=Lactococcus phage P1048 TaxID=2662295 RepID=A0A649V431_9CAUD|nr:nucleoside 2-deoxyribosyltransferase [Lactococcus phage P1048]QGJ84976.1 nucleoside 2-deoxyribosyltransferase [Lactococcus phage P1048]
MNKVKIYFASPLFSDMERWFNTDIVDSLRYALPENVEIYLPQENEAINDKSGYANSVMIAEADTNELLGSDFIVAVLDGATIDVGVASEIGVAYAKGIPVIGLYSDSRQGAFGNTNKINALEEVGESQFSYINLYTVGLVKSNGTLFKDVGDWFNYIVDEAKKLSEEKETND